MDTYGQLLLVVNCDDLCLPRPFFLSSFREAYYSALHAEAVTSSTRLDVLGKLLFSHSASTYIEMSNLWPRWGHGEFLRAVHITHELPFRFPSVKLNGVHSTLWIRLFHCLLE